MADAAGHTINKKQLSEADICTKFIVPAIKDAGWNIMTQVREQYHFTAGRIIVRGKNAARAKSKFADYVLFYRPNIPIAIIEAKDNNHPVAGGMQQVLKYAEALHIPYVYTSNGDAFAFHDRTGQSVAVESIISLADFPSPDDLWARYCKWKGIEPEHDKVVLQPYQGNKKPRYYQVNAINEAVEAIVKGQNRLLLVMATGTGKTFTAFQIIYRLFNARAKKRILFLADRNILIDQTMVNDFRPFQGKMAKLSTRSKVIERDDGTEIELPIAIDRKRRIDTSYEIYLGLYQALTGPEENQKIFKELSPDFFDLIIIDECHRGSAAEDSAWREILEYFSGATQIGLTATPKETEYVSNIHYFGEPIYTYSLKQGIADGFLAPYKVVRVHIDRDIEGYRPSIGQLDSEGNPVDDRLYNIKDFDRSIVLTEREKIVARKITQYLQETGDAYQKTIVFCVDTEHASRMRTALINQNDALYQQNSNYIMRITGDDPEGKLQLDNFIDPESRYPVIVTTSKLLSTGVDAQTCRAIVLDREVGSMTEFKQILGRGTRVHEDTGKLYFTLIDFRGASNHFADPDFDGMPTQVYEPGEDDPIAPPDDGEEPEPGLPGNDDDEVIIDPIDREEEWEDPDFPVPPNGPYDPGNPEPRRKIYVHGVPVSIIAERVQHLDENGRLVTESLRDFTRNQLLKKFASMDAFLTRWNSADKKRVIIEELEQEGILLEHLKEEAGKDLDPFDLVCHLAFDRPALTRRQRAEKVRKQDIFSKYGPSARAVLEALLQKYQDSGPLDLDNTRILTVPPFTSLGTPLELVKQFGSREAYFNAVHELQSALYQEAA